MEDKWPDDKLDRASEADFLYKYLIGRYKTDTNNEFESLVLNINASWRLGKTFFLEKWTEDLKKQKHPVVFFNAWASDFQNDPLVAFMSEIETQLEKYFDQSAKAKSALKKAFKGGIRLLRACS